jgi:hypothetical protein
VGVKQLYAGAICRTAEREGRVGEGATIYSVETAFVFAAPEGVGAVEVDYRVALAVLDWELGLEEHSCEDKQPEEKPRTQEEDFLLFLWE